jgi:monoamine oxidase
MNQIYDYVIIGGGIGGLYFSYEILKKYPNAKIIILESAGRMGGRVLTHHMTYHETELSFEEGAGVISTTHNHMLKLVEELELSDKLIKMNSPTNMFITDKGSKNMETTEIFNVLLKKIQQDMNQRSDKIVVDELIGLNLFNLMKKYLGLGKATQYSDEYMYNDILYLSNSIDAIRFLSYDIYNKGFFLLNGGMDQIISRLITKLDNKVIISMNSHVEFVNHTDKYFDIGISNGTIYRCINVMLACPKLAINNISINGITNSQQTLLYKLIHSVIESPLIRVYCKFPKNNKNEIWFKDLHKFTVKPPIKYFIPINYEKGLAMISYTDTINAQILWAKYKRNELKQYILDFYRGLFPDIHIPDIEIFYVCYYDAGVHYWASNHMGKKYYSQVQKPFDDMNLYILGEAYSMRQTWCEGALESVSDIIKSL